MTKVFNRPIKLGGHLREINGVSVRALEYDLEGNIARASGETVPSGKGYAKGCLFVRTNASNGSRATYENVGDSLVANFRLVDGFAKVALAAGAANAFAFAWQNPEATKILVTRVLVDRTTAGGTAGSVLDIGVVASATDTANTIIDGLDLNATGIGDSLNATDAGTSGTAKAVKVDEKGGTNDYITGKILTQKAENLVGNVYIYYTNA
jgi:hypothetical protein